MTKDIHIERPSDLAKLLQGDISKISADHLSEVIASCYNQGMTIEGKDPREYALEHMIEKYLSSSTKEERSSLEKQYNQVHAIGVDQQLLGMDSDLGKFLSDPKSPQIIANHRASSNTRESFAKVDFTKYDLKVIGKAVEVFEQSHDKPPRDYDKFTNLQKAAMVFSALIGPVGPVLAYYAIKAHNNKEKEAADKVLQASPKEERGDKPSWAERVTQNAKNTKDIQSGRG